MAGYITFKNKEDNKMKRSERTPISPFVTACAAALAMGGMAAIGSADEADEPQEAEAQSEGTSSVPASMHFTDEHGNRREPTAEEVRETAEAFQRDLARLAGKQRGKPQEETRPDGSVSVLVAPGKLVYLTVEQTEDGELRYHHTRLDEDGNVLPANRLPEK